MIIFMQVISLMKIQHFSNAMTIKYPRQIYGNPATDFDRKLKQWKPCSLKVPFTKLLVV